MSLSSINALLGEALPRLNASSAALNASGMAEISVSGLKLGVEYREQDDRLLIYCSTGRLPDTADSDFYNFLLQKNLFGAELGGGHLGLYAPTRSLIFSLGLDASALDAQKLVNALSLFIEAATGLIKEVEERGRQNTQQVDSSMFMGNMLWV